MAPVIGTTLLYLLQYLKFRGYGLSVLGLMCTTTALLIMTDWQAIGSDVCTEYSLFQNPQLADQYRLQLAESNVSESGMVSIQSLQVVEEEVYQLAVNRCESAGEHCHWIPNSHVTGKHCSDCQPICRSTTHTLNFVQFIVGIVLFLSTSSLLYSGSFLLLSESVSQKYQGISTASMVALEGIARSAFPLICKCF
ncbi:hypothetical protein GBAR_LOCUS3955 [Geodia barretti]|uniref:Uncharacterized protein n=1 Tax=Geodia barretti TaxID=519541 RepID=A0AA35R656_GEOBA|nr:hypothetical protein GBAR_LOCUS3955 [Geodia barretti]